MSYEIKTYYVDVSYYLNNSSASNLDRLRRDKIEKVIEVFGFTGGEWKTEKNNGIDVAVGRYATLEGYPFTFYIERGSDFSTMAQIYLANSETKQTIVRLCTMPNCYYDGSTVTDFTRYHFCGMVEKIIDIGGGCHFSTIDKLYTNDKTLSYDGNRITSIAIIPVYDIETNELFDWVISNGNGWYTSNTLSRISLLDFTNEGAYIAINTRDTQSTDYPTLTPTQIIFSTVGACEKYYAVGIGAVGVGLSIDTSYESVWNNRTNIKDKIVFLNAKDGKDLFFIRNQFKQFIAYVEEEITETT